MWIPFLHFDDRKDERMKVYSIRDQIAGIYSGLYMFSNDAVACRWFSVMCRDSNEIKPIYKDMQLYRVGMFDQDSGHLTDCAPELVMKGVDLDGNQE